jgi:hypothetical protein
MADDRQTNWFASGSFLERMTKESLIVFPVALLMTWYGAIRYSDRIDVSRAMYWVIVFLITVGMSAFFAYRSQRKIARNATLPSGAVPENIEPK